MFSLSVAFSTNFIPRLMHSYSKELNKIEYLDFIYAVFKTSDFEKDSNMVDERVNDPEYCRYPEFRNGPDADPPYKRPDYYWKILAARLAFILIFQNVVVWLQQFIDWVIPDKPDKLDSLIKRENYLVSSKIIQEERARKSHNNEVDYVNERKYYDAKS
jgi:anoctamin-1